MAPNSIKAFVRDLKESARCRSCLSDARRGYMTCVEFGSRTGAEMGASSFFTSCIAS